jgi:hypothetical protein
MLLSKKFVAVLSALFILVGLMAVVVIPVLHSLADYRLKWLSVVGWVGWGMLCLGLVLQAVSYLLRRKRDVPQ